jgi:hypothetical protein
MLILEAGGTYNYHWALKVNPLFLFDMIMFT